MMGDEFEVWNWERSLYGDYQWVRYFSGESKDDAFAKIEELKGSGEKCVKLVWR